MVLVNLWLDVSSFQGFGAGDGWQNTETVGGGMAAYGRCSEFWYFGSGGLLQNCVTFNISKNQRAYFRNFMMKSIHSKFIFFPVNSTSRTHWVKERGPASFQLCKISCCASKENMTAFFRWPRWTVQLLTERSCGKCMKKRWQVSLSLQNIYTEQCVRKANLFISIHTQFIHY